MSWLVLLLLAGAPDAGARLAAPGLPFVWELPPKTIEEIPIEGVTYVDRVPVRLRQLVVIGTPEQIGKHFFQSFLRQGLYIAPRQALDRLLTGVDPGSVVTYSVVLQANEQGRTTVILGESRVLDRKPAAPEDLPVLPQAKGVVPVQLEGFELLSYSVEVPEAEVRAFYARQLAARGYVRGEADRWSRPSDSLQLTVVPEGARSKIQLRQTLP